MAFAHDTLPFLLRPLQPVLSGHEENQQGRETLAPGTPSEANDSIVVTTASPPGITCTRSAALGLPSPLVADILCGGDDSGKKEGVRNAGDTEIGEGGGDEPDGNDKAGLSRPRKGGKLAHEGRARTVPLTVGEGAAAGGGMRRSLEGG